jgi:protein-tyrosine phosphatase
MDDVPFSILFVCTGNQCRSPLAAAITRSLTAGLPVEVSSAGTMALPPTPVPPETRLAASSLGYELGDHRSRPMTEVEPTSFDLVIGFELRHIATAVVDHETDRTKTFLLRQLVNSLPQPVDGRPGNQGAVARVLVADANERRGKTPPSLADMIPDPIGRSSRTHMETARTIDELCRQLVGRLFPRKN